MSDSIQARIDAGALRHNLRVIRKRSRGARVMGVVKANAYGHGLVAVSRVLEADALAVARIEEGLALRAAGIDRPIVLLEGVFSGRALAQAVQGSMELVVHGFPQIELLEQQPAPAPVLWIKIDTGMNRLGFRPEELPAAMERIRRLAPREIRLLTHCADGTDSELTRRQVARFEEATQGLDHPWSIASSTGVLTGLPGGLGDWVRPGIALYGASPLLTRTGAAHGLKPVMTLETRVIAVRRVPTGETVGYSATWRASRDSLIAIAAAGYADGLLRRLPSGTPVLVGGAHAPLAGLMSMDMIAVDVTALPQVSVGERVVLWGEGRPVEQIARLADTIPYELLSAVSERVPRQLV